MPLLNSPIDGSPMKQIHRFGIEIDVCPTSGGIWLDKGELEKIMAMLREENISAERPGKPSRNRDWDDDDDHDDDPIKYKYARKSKTSRIMDIFDF